MVSRLERGRIAAMAVGSVREIAQALDAEVLLVVRWRGGELDRLMDEGHATLVGRAVEILQSLGWETRSEVSYSIYGERGSIDVLAWHAPTRTLLVVEVKSELISVEETLRVHDAKLRLAPRIAAERFGWQATATARLLVLPDLSTARRRVSAPSCRARRCLPASGTHDSRLAHLANADARVRRCGWPPVPVTYAGDAWSERSCQSKAGSKADFACSLSTDASRGRSRPAQIAPNTRRVRTRRSSRAPRLATRRWCVGDARRPKASLQRRALDRDRPDRRH